MLDVVELHRDGERIPVRAGKTADKAAGKRPVTIGVQSYSFRDRPLDDAIAFAAKSANLTGADARPRYIEQDAASWKTLLRDFTQKDQAGGDTAIDPWTRIAHRPQELLARALADAQALAYGPAIQVRCIECGASEPAPLQAFIDFARKATSQRSADMQAYDLSVAT